MTYEDVFLPVAKEAGMTPERLGAWNGLVKAYIRGLLEAQRAACGNEIRGRLPQCAHGVALSFDAVASIAETTPLVEIK